MRALHSLWRLYGYNVNSVLLLCYHQKSFRKNKKTQEQKKEYFNSMV